MNQELMQKMLRDEPLSAEEMALLETALSQSEGLGEVVKASVAPEAPSLRWRSDLNEKLIALTPRRAKRFVWLKWAAPTLVAASVGFGFFIAQSPMTTTPNGELGVSELRELASNGSFEAGLVAAHMESNVALEISSTPTLDQPVSVEGSTGGGTQWESSDLDAF
jgi:hypothetical protein